MKLLQEAEEASRFKPIKVFCQKSGIQIRQVRLAMGERGEGRDDTKQGRGYNFCMSLNLLVKFNSTFKNHVIFEE